MPFIHSANTVLNTSINRPCSRIGNTALNKNKGTQCQDRLLFQWVGHCQWVGKECVFRLHPGLGGPGMCSGEGFPEPAPTLAGAWLLRWGPSALPWSTCPARFLCLCLPEFPAQSSFSRPLLCCLNLYFLALSLYQVRMACSLLTLTPVFSVPRGRNFPLYSHTSRSISHWSKRRQGPSLVLFDLSWLF